MTANIEAAATALRAAFPGDPGRVVAVIDRQAERLAECALDAGSPAEAADAILSVRSFAKSTFIARHVDKIATTVLEAMV